jgi:hypothetical protein
MARLRFQSDCSVGVRHDRSDRGRSVVVGWTDADEDSRGGAATLRASTASPSEDASSTSISTPPADRHPSTTSPCSFSSSAIARLVASSAGRSAMRSSKQKLTRLAGYRRSRTRCRLSALAHANQRVAPAARGSRSSTTTPRDASAFATNVDARAASSTRSPVGSTHAGCPIAHGYGEQIGSYGAAAVQRN